MLVLTRGDGEKIVMKIRDHVIATITVSIKKNPHASGDKVRLCIEAPAIVRVFRKELLDGQ